MIRGGNVFIFLYHNITFLFSIIRSKSYHHIGFLIVAIFVNRYLLSSYYVHKVISVLLMAIINGMIVSDIIKTIKSDDMKYQIIPSKYGLFTVSLYIILSYLIISSLTYIGLCLFYTNIQEVLYVFITTVATVYGISSWKQSYNIRSIAAYSIVCLLSIGFAYIKFVILSLICLWIAILMSTYKLSKYLSL
jgi:hypothetical protein